MDKNGNYSYDVVGVCSKNDEENNISKDSNSSSQTISGNFAGPIEVKAVIETSPVGSSMEESSGSSSERNSKILTFDRLKRLYSQMMTKDDMGVCISIKDESMEDDTELLSGNDDENTDQEPVDIEPILDESAEEAEESMMVMGGIQDDIINSIRSKQTVESLQNLSLNKVMENLQLLNHTKVKALNETIQNILQSSMESFGKLYSPHIQPMLLTNCTNHVTVNLASGPKNSPTSKFCSWNAQNVSALFDTIIENCKENVTSLEMNLEHREFKLLVENEWKSTPTILQLHTVIRSMTSLTILVLHKCEVNDKTLEVIAKSCPKLNHLDLYQSEMISNYGISCAFNKDINKDICENLLFLNLQDTGVTNAGIIIIFKNVINLNILRHKDVNKSICKYERDNPCHELKITMINITKNENFESPCRKNKIIPQKDKNLTQEDITTIFEACQNIKILHIDKVLVSQYSLNLLYKLTDLTLIWDKNNYGIPTYINDFITRNIHLTNLVLVDITTQIDISNIGVHCPNIQSIIIHQNIICTSTIHSRFCINENCFKQLKLIELEYYNEKLRFSLNVLEAILSSPALQFVYISSIYIPDITMESIITKIQEDGIIFQNLHTLSLPQTIIKLDFVKQIMLIAPKLKKIVVSPHIHDININPHIYTQLKTIAAAFDIELIFN